MAISEIFKQLSVRGFLGLGHGRCGGLPGRSHENNCRTKIWLRDRGWGKWKTSIPSL